MWQYNKTETLTHHGILGQKWGVRRFQNKDGTLTEKGIRRYQDKDGRLTNEGRKKYDEDVFGRGDEKFWRQMDADLKKSAQENRESWERITSNSDYRCWNRAADIFDDSPQKKALEAKYKKKYNDPENYPESFWKQYQSLWNETLSETALEMYGECPVE